MNLHIDYNIEYNYTRQDSGEDLNGSDVSDHDLLICRTYLDISIDSSPPDGMGLPQQYERPGHHRDVLQNLLLDLGQRGHVGKISYNKWFKKLEIKIKKRLLSGRVLIVRNPSQMCWLAMPLGAGFLRWVLACRTIEKKTESRIFC